MLLFIFLFSSFSFFSSFLVAKTAGKACGFCFLRIFCPFCVKLPGKTIGIYRAVTKQECRGEHRSSGGFVPQNRIAARRYFIIFLRKINKLPCNLLADGQWPPLQCVIQQHDKLKFEGGRRRSPLQGSEPGGPNGVGLPPQRRLVLSAATRRRIVCGHWPH